MAFCPNCGASVDGSSRFCPNCGSDLSAQQSGAQQNYNQQYNNQQNYNQQYNQQQYNQQQYNQPYDQQPSYGAPTGQISFGQRNIAVAIILSIVTCGIYSIFWFINMVDQVNEASGNQNAQSGGMVFLLSIVTCGIYQLYWFYKAGENLANAKRMRGLVTDSNASIIYLVLGIFGLSIVTYALIQNELNGIAEYHGAPKA